MKYTPSGNITANPPRVTTTQCGTALPSGVNQRCLPNVLAAAPRTLRELLMTDEGEGLEMIVAMGMAVVPQLTTLLNDPDPQVRARAAAALGRVAGPAAVSALQPLVLRDPDPVVRLVTANTLARFAGAATEPVVAASLRDPDVGCASTRCATLRSSTR